jgi:hypothetical protein
LCGRETAAKGLNPDHKINPKKLQDFVFKEDLERLKLLKKIPKPTLPGKVPTLFYPGCGADLLFPLLYVQKLFSLKEIVFIFLDEHDTLSIIKTILDDLGVSFSEDKAGINFYWDALLVHLHFLALKVEEVLDHLPYYDFYFERAFRIMKESIPDYEQKIVSGLAPGGILISDSGFEQQPLEYIDIPTELSSYGEMVMGVKKK